MNKQYHFVVLWDEDTGRFIVDNETAEDMFKDGTVYNKTHGEWNFETEDEEVFAYELEGILKSKLS